MFIVKKIVQYVQKCTKNKLKVSKKVSLDISNPAPESYVQVT